MPRIGTIHCLHTSTPCMMRNMRQPRGPTRTNDGGLRAPRTPSTKRLKPLGKQGLSAWREHGRPRIALNNSSGWITSITRLLPLKTSLLPFSKRRPATFANSNSILRRVCAQTWTYRRWWSRRTTLWRRITLKLLTPSPRPTSSPLGNWWCTMVRRGGIPTGIRSRKILLTSWWRIYRTTWSA